MNARHLAESELVNFLGGQASGGGSAQGEGVVIKPLGELPGPVVIRGNLLLGLEHREQAGICGLDRVGQRRARVGPQLFPWAGRHVLQRPDLARKILPQRALLGGRIERLAADDFLDRVHDEREHKAGRDDVLGLADPYPLDQLVEQRAQTPQPGDIGLGVRHAGDRMVVDQERRRLRMQARHLVEGVVVVAPPPALDAALGIIDEHPITDLGLIIQLLEINGALQLRIIPDREDKILQRPGLGDVIPLVHVLLDPQLRHEHGAAGDGLVEHPVEKDIGPGRLGGHGRRRDGGGRRARRPQAISQKGEEEEARQQEAWIHGAKRCRGKPGTASPRRHSRGARARTRKSGNPEVEDAQGAIFLPTLHAETRRNLNRPRSL